MQLPSVRGKVLYPCLTHAELRWHDTSDLLVHSRTFGRSSGLNIGPTEGCLACFGALRLLLCCDGCKRECVQHTYQASVLDSRAVALISETQRCGCASAHFIETFAFLSQGIRTSPDILCDAAIMRCNMRQTGAAVELYQHALSACPSHAGALINYANLATVQVWL